jgi:hypothetical protein
MPLVLGNPHNPQRLTAILPKPGTNNSHPRYTQFPIPVHRMSNPGPQNVRFRYKRELHIRKQVLRCSGVELHKRVTGFVGHNFHKSVEIPPRSRQGSFTAYKQPQNKCGEQRYESGMPVAVPVFEIVRGDTSPIIESPEKTQLQFWNSSTQRFLSGSRTPNSNDAGQLS